ncbi:hypothetical protein RFI_17646 [Reticulomyxa filosa]|uniref:VWFA domain-containing protein n=1 Tax=Reticulomyxa filosa TaxID=46433 RepID=X6N0Z0_RETFI|nr:hypothetical protein RFI_17646 [Reticulomyxa filosa]|eukprot:ETO19583.1 hypothetical protein RFI_17646 [Reticulomyxa filosa]
MMNLAGGFGTSLHKTKQVSAFSLSDFEHEGIFARYYFDTCSKDTKERQGELGAEEKKELEAKQEQSKKEIEQEFFSIRRNYARSHDPLSNEMQEWLGLGLHSKYDGKKGIAKYGRPPVMLMVALDVSGSMDCTITASEGEMQSTSKIEIAKHSLLSMLRQLKDNDSIGIVTFNTQCEVLFPLTVWKQANAESLKKVITSVVAGGGTDLSVAFAGASKVLKEKRAKDSSSVPSNTQYRILFLTDMQPNSGERRKTGLFGLAEECANEQIYTTFVGVGEDFGSDLAQYISTDLKGAQYMTVRTAKEFEDLMTENFEYSIFPIIFDFK